MPLLRAPSRSPRRLAFAARGVHVPTALTFWVPPCGTGVGLAGDSLSFGYSWYNAHQAFHKCLFNGVSRHNFVLTAEERPTPVGCHDALSGDIGRDLRRDRRNTEAPCEREVEATGEKLVIAASRTPPWLASGWGFRGRRLSIGRGSPDKRRAF